MQRRAGSVRPGVEHMETRVLPSIFSVGGTFGTGTKPLGLVLADVNRDG
jgi:hypothetical protein